MFLSQKKLPKSLTIRTTFNAVFSCVLLGTISLLIGLTLYSTSLLSQHIHHAFQTAKNASVPASRTKGSELFAKEILRRYRELTPEQFDDMTMLCLEYKGAGNPIQTEKDV